MPSADDQGQNDQAQSQPAVDPDTAALAEGLEKLRKAHNRLQRMVGSLFLTQVVTTVAGLVYLAMRGRGRRRKG